MRLCIYRRKGPVVVVVKRPHRKLTNNPPEQTLYVYAHTHKRNIVSAKEFGAKSNPIVKSSSFGPGQKHVIRPPMFIYASRKLEGSSSSSTQ